jgi:hypothetical protein
MEQGISPRQLRMPVAIFEIDHRKLEPHHQAQLAKLLGRKPAEQQPDGKIRPAGFQVPHEAPPLQNRFLSFAPQDIVTSGELARLEEAGVVNRLSTPILRPTDRGRCGLGTGHGFGSNEGPSVVNLDERQPVREGEVREKVVRASEGMGLNVRPTILPRGRVRLELEFETRSYVLDRIADQAGHPLPAIGIIKYTGETTVRPGRHVVLSGIGHPAPVRIRPDLANEQAENAGESAGDQPIAMQREIIVVLTPEIVDSDE